MVMYIDAYLNRIGYHGTRTTNLETLSAIHQAHLTAIAYENLDIHLGHTISLNLEHIYTKIVQRGRGGWCYEMNSLLAWALRELGFTVTMLGAAVGATATEGRQHLDHMALLVMLDEPWLLDAGFGNAFLEPLPLREGTYQQAFHTFQLAHAGEYWHFTNHQYGGAGFDFLLQPRRVEEFATRCTWLQTAPESAFVRLTSCHRMFTDYRIVSLRGAVLVTIDANGKSQRIIDTPTAYKAALTNTFGLDLSDQEISQLWDTVWPAHVAWANLQMG